MLAGLHAGTSIPACVPVPIGLNRAPMTDEEFEKIAQYPAKTLIEFIAGDHTSSVRRVAAEEELKNRRSAKSERIAKRALIVSLLALIVSAAALLHSALRSPQNPKPPAPAAMSP